MKRTYIPALLCSLLVPVLCGCPSSNPSASRDVSTPPTAAAFTLPLDVSASVLGQFTDDQLEPLRRHLASSAGWKLTHLGKATVAIRREPADESTPDAGKLRMSGDGFYFKHQPWRRYRALLRIGREPVPVEPEWRGLLTPAASGQREAQLKVQPANLPDHRSYLALSANGPVCLEIMEESMDTGRESTRRLFTEANTEFQKVLGALPVLNERGYVPGVAPKESVRTGAPLLKIETAHEPGAYHLLGYVNPGEPGYVYARALDGSGAALAPDALREQTLEYVGWSKLPQQQFFCNSQLRLPTGSARLAGVELWFHANTGSERKLLTATVK